jgi:quercetin dioxygenase-like cupin family protein
MLTYGDAMNVIRSGDAPVFDAAGTTVTAYAAPSRGSAELSVWRLELEPGSTSPLHHMDREEVFLGLEGRVIATVDGREQELGAGDCLILPPGSAFTFHVPDDTPFRGVACLPAGALATLAADGSTFAPPWAE